MTPDSAASAASAASDALASPPDGSLLSHLVGQGDGVTLAVGALLLLMSVSAWVLIFWKTWVLRRARVDMARGIPLFWSSASVQDAQARVAACDRDRVIAPLLEAALQPAASGTLDGGGQRESQLTRRLRDALHGIVQQLQFGQVLLASVGATAPFLGLLGTVWGIYHALIGMSSARSVTIDKLAGPVGEALVMTAAGLVVAIPAVLAYNVFGKLIGACEAELEGFAFDLRQMMADPSSRVATTDGTEPSALDPA